jgi:hypothetical protein
LTSSVSAAILVEAGGILPFGQRDLGKGAPAENGDGSRMDNRIPMVALGRTGLRVTRLGIGGGYCETADADGMYIVPVDEIQRAIQQRRAPVRAFCSPLASTTRGSR